MSDIDLAPIMRGNGKAYRPRRLACHAVSGDGAELVAVIVFGTHEPDRAQSLAAESARYWGGCFVNAVAPSPGWWRDTIVRGERTFAIDPVRGRAGVWFDVVEDEDES